MLKRLLFILSFLIFMAVTVLLFTLSFPIFMAVIVLWIVSAPFIGSLFYIITGMNYFKMTDRLVSKWWSLFDDA